VKLSIITIHLNNFQGLARTLRSLSEVSFSPSVEWVVIDGGSLKNHDQNGIINQVRSLAHSFSSEPDDGIYDAMNKGTRLASGDYVLYLNAGDELHPDFDPEELDNMVSEFYPEMIWGNCDVHYQDGTQIRVKSRSRAWVWYCMPVFHPAIFFDGTYWGGSPMTHDINWQQTTNWCVGCW